MQDIVRCIFFGTALVHTASTQKQLDNMYISYMYVYIYIYRERERDP